jgi:hypothetical protein
MCVWPVICTAGFEKTTGEPPVRAVFNNPKGE